MKGTELEVFNGNEKSKNNEELPKFSTRLATFFLSVGISEEDLSSARIDLKKLDELYNIPWHRRVRTWLSYDETIRKMMLWFWLSDECIKVSPQKLVNKNFKSDGINVQPLLEEGDNKEERKKRSFLASRVWMESNTLPFEDTTTLKGILSVNGFLSGIEFMTSQVWSGVLFSFLAVELYYWLVYPDLRYGKTLKDIFFPQQGRAGILANSMTAPTVWPILFVLPAAYGLLRSILKPRSLSTDPAIMLENVKKAANEYKPGFWQDFLIWYVFPKHNLKSRIRDAETHLLLDGRSAPETRKEMLEVLQRLVAQSNHETQLMAIQCLTELADSLGKRDIKRLIAAGVLKEELLNRLELKVSAMEILEDLGRYHPSIITPSKNRVLNLIIPIRRYIHAHYALWELGNPQNDLLQLVFWLQKGWRFYSKGALLLILIQAIKKIIERKRLKRECHEAENVWLYMPQIEDYNCSVCGDLPVYYKDMFTVRDCMLGILGAQRNVSFLVAAFKRFGYRFPKNISLDFSAQTEMNNQNIPELMNAIGVYSKNVLEVKLTVSRQDKISNGSFVEMSENAARALAKMVKDTELRLINFYSEDAYFGLGNIGASALGAILNQSNVFYLNLEGNNIGDEGAKRIGQGLPQSKVTSLDLSDNKIADEGAKGLGQGLLWSNLMELNFGANNIGDEGARWIGQSLPRSSLVSLKLQNNNIGDEGARWIGQSLLRSKVMSLDLFGNNIGVEGVKAIGYGLVESGVIILILGSNKINNEGAKWLAKSFSASNITNLNLENIGIDDEGARYIGNNLPRSHIMILDLTRNNINDEGAKWIGHGLFESKVANLVLSDNNIGSEGAKGIAEGLYGSQVTSLDLGFNNIGDEGTRWISQGLFGANVTKLNLCGNNISAAGTRWLGQYLADSNVTSLDLGWNNIDAEGARWIGQSLLGSQVTDLNLWGNKIGDEGARWISQGLFESNVTRLTLVSNNIGNEGAKWIGKSLLRSSLTSLELQGNNISNEGARSIGQGLPGSMVKNLCLFNNNIGSEGGKWIGQGLLGSSVVKLLLNGNNIGDQGAKWIGESLSESKVTSLDLGDNNIGDEGAKWIWQGLLGSNVTSLYFWSNQIGDEGIFSLTQALLPSIQKTKELWIEKLDTSRRIASVYEKSTALITEIYFAGNINITDKGVLALCDVLPYTDLIPNKVVYFSPDPDVVENKNIRPTAPLCLSFRSSAIGLRPPFPIDVIGKALVFVKEGIYPSRANYRLGFKSENINNFSSGASIAMFLAMIVLIYNLCTKKKKRVLSFFYRDKVGWEDKKIKKTCSKRQ